MAIWRAISKLMAYYPTLNFSSFQIFFNSKVYYTGTVQSPNDEESVFSQRPGLQRIKFAGSCGWIEGKLNFGLENK